MRGGLQCFEDLVCDLCTALLKIRCHLSWNLCSNADGNAKNGISAEALTMEIHGSECRSDIGTGNGGQRIATLNTPIKSLTYHKRKLAAALAPSYPSKSSKSQQVAAFLSVHGLPRGGSMMHCAISGEDRNLEKTNEAAK
jgi:hypothetical protein